MSAATAGNVDRKEELATTGGRNPLSPERTRLSLPEFLADSRVMAARQLRKVSRRPVYIVYLLVQPVMFVLLFTYVLGGAIDTGSIDYVNYLIPGIMVQTAIFGALTTGLGLTEDIKAGVVDRFRSLPIARSAVLVGRTTADLAANGVTLVVMLLVGLVVGFRPGEPVWSIVLALLLVLAFAYVFSWISAFVGLLVKNPEAAQSVGFIWVFPLTFISSAFVPTDSMPAALQWFADINPVTLCVNASRALMIGDGDAAGPALGTLAWLVGLLIVFVPLAARAFRRA